MTSWTEEDIAHLRIKHRPSDRNRTVSRGAQGRQPDRHDPRVSPNELTPTTAGLPYPDLCRLMGLPVPVAEHRFHPVRKWRFDWAFVPPRIAVEVEGGAFTNGRHTRGAGFLKDIEKYGEAAALGWVVIRVVPKQLTDVRTFEWIRRAISARDQAA
jgi:hypothetical protein